MGTCGVHCSAHSVIIVSIGAAIVCRLIPSVSSNHDHQMVGAHSNTCTCTLIKIICATRTFDD